MSHSPLWARPASTDATMNRTRPPRYIARRPTTSPMRPIVTSSAANTSAYDVFTHSAAVRSRLRSRMIEGTATFTIVASTMIIDTPTLSIARPIHRPRPLSWMADGPRPVAFTHPAALRSIRAPSAVWSGALIHDIVALRTRCVTQL